MDTGGAMHHLFARKPPSIWSPRGPFDSESVPTSSHQKFRGAKSALYRDPRYAVVLATEGSFMDKDDRGIGQASKDMVKRLLEQEQQEPQRSLFQDDIFDRVCRKLRDRNEPRIIRDISPLIVPSAEILTICGARELSCLTETVDESWSNSIALTSTRPQPDYAVGFCQKAFTDEQLRKLQPFVGGWAYQSFFRATYLLYFPFLTCEVSCGASSPDVADRQNAHSMTLAVRAVVELFRLVKREHELDREIVAFSVSHDHQSVRIYGHYAVIDDTKTRYYRHPICAFDFTALDGKDKWTSYKFVKNVYLTWMPAHFQRLCSVIDALPADLS